MPTVWRWVRWALAAAVLVLLTLIVGGAYDARRRLPDLKPWHRTSFDDLKASTMGDAFTFAQYREREDRLFAQVEALESTIDPLGPHAGQPLPSRQPVASLECGP